MRVIRLESRAFNMEEGINLHFASYMGSLSTYMDSGFAAFKLRKGKKMNETMFASLGLFIF